MFLRNSITDLFYKNRFFFFPNKRWVYPKNRFMVGSKLYLGMDKGGKGVGVGGGTIEGFLKERRGREEGVKERKGFLGGLFKDIEGKKKRLVECEVVVKRMGR